MADAPERDLMAWMATLSADLDHPDNTAAELARAFDRAEGIERSIGTSPEVIYAFYQGGCIQALTLGRAGTDEFHLALAAAARRALDRAVVAS